MVRSFVCLWLVIGANNASPRRRKLLTRHMCLETFYEFAWKIRRIFVINDFCKTRFAPTGSAASFVPTTRNPYADGFWGLPPNGNGRWTIRKENNARNFNVSMLIHQVMMLMMLFLHQFSCTSEFCMLFSTK